MADRDAPEAGLLIDGYVRKGIEQGATGGPRGRDRCDLGQHQLERPYGDAVRRRQAQRRRARAWPIGVEHYSEQKSVFIAED